MAPRKGESNELKRFLLASRETATAEWLAGMRAKPELRKNFPRQLADEYHLENLSGLYGSLVDPLSIPTKTGKTRKPRLAKAQKDYLTGVSLHDIQNAQLALLDVLIAAVGEKFGGKPKKIEKLSALLTRRTHDLMLSAGKADAGRYETAAARAQSKYARLLDMATDAIFLPDYKTGLFVEVNEAACKLTGYSEAELKQMGFNSLVSVFDLNLAIDKVNTALEQGAVRFDDLSIYTKKGGEIPVDISVSVAKIEDRRHVIVIARDIKERKTLEKKLREEAKRLRLVNEIGSAITSVDLEIEAVLKRILEAIARVIKVEAGSILRLEGERLVFMVALGEKAEYVKPFRIKLGQGIAGWVAETGEELIVRDVHKDPRYYSGVEEATGFITRSMLAVPMKAGDRIVGVIELINKIGGGFTKKDLKLISAIASFSAVALEHARLYCERELSEKRLAEAGSPLSPSRLAAVVAHEMKDPLGILKNYVRILRDKLPSSPGAQGEELGVVAGEADRIADIVDQLLNFSEASTEEPRETPLNLLVENSVGYMTEKLESSGISTQLKLQSRLPDVSVIPNRMKMVFSNLLRLAIADMPEGGTLTIATRKRNSSICVEFSSTGKKHTGREADELFLPSAVAKGLVPKGIGLYMVHSIICGIGGRIEVRPRRGGGSSFRITIPMEPDNGAGGGQ
jgi:PAS domain S-box-containing protein